MVRCCAGRVSRALDQNSSARPIAIPIFQSFSNSCATGTYICALRSTAADRYGTAGSEPRTVGTIRPHDCTSGQSTGVCRSSLYEEFGMAISAQPKSVVPPAYVWLTCTLSLLSLDKVAEKVPDEFLFSQIVALARIPPSGVETLRNGLIEELYEEWCWHSRPELSTGRILSTPTEKDRVRSRMLKKIARSLTILAADLKELNDEEVRFVDGVWAPTNKRSRNTGPTILSCKQMVPMAELFGKLLLKRPSARRRPRK